MAGDVGKAMDVVQAAQAAGIDPSVQQLIVFVVIATLLLGGIAWIVIQVRKQNPAVERLEGSLATTKASLYDELAEQNAINIKRADDISDKYNKLREEVGELRWQLHDFEEFKARVNSMRKRLDEKDAKIDNLLATAKEERDTFSEERQQYLDIIKSQEAAISEMRRALDTLQQRLSADEKGVFSCPFHPDLGVSPITHTITPVQG